MGEEGCQEGQACSNRQPSCQPTIQQLVCQPAIPTSPNWPQCLPRSRSKHHRRWPRCPLLNSREARDCLKSSYKNGFEYLKKLKFVWSMKHIEMQRTKCKLI